MRALKGSLGEVIHGIPRQKQRRAFAVIVLSFGLLGMITGYARAQDPEDELGDWFIFNGTIRFSDRWSVFTEAQVRLWEPVSNLNEILVRAAAHYNFTPTALVGLGYLHSDAWPFHDAANGGRDKSENRIYEQLTLNQAWARSLIEHRFRLEQRWVETKNTGDTDYFNRARYRLQATVPLNSKSMEPGAYFVNAYNEIFINFGGGERTFDQNRLYAAFGRQFTPDSNLQLGLLWQARRSADFFRVQIFYTHNFDLR